MSCGPPPACAGGASWDIAVVRVLCTAVHLSARQRATCDRHQPATTPHNTMPQTLHLPTRLLKLLTATPNSTGRATCVVAETQQEGKNEKQISVPTVTHSLAAPCQLRSHHPRCRSRRSAPTQRRHLRQQTRVARRTDLRWCNRTAAGCERSAQPAKGPEQSGVDLADAEALPFVREVPRSPRGADLPAEGGGLLRCRPCSPRDPRVGQHRRRERRTRRTGRSCTAGSRRRGARR